MDIHINNFTSNNVFLSKLYNYIIFFHNLQHPRQRSQKRGPPEGAVEVRLERSFGLGSSQCLTGNCDSVAHLDRSVLKNCRQSLVTYVVFVEGEVVGGQHSDSQTRAKRRIQEVADDGLILQQEEDAADILWKELVNSQACARTHDCLSPGCVYGTP